MIIHSEPIAETVTTTETMQETSQVTEIAKQPTNNVPIEKPKYGFAAHPENINKKGRPKSGLALTDIMKEVLEEEMPSGKTRKELLVRKVLEGAFNGNENLIKLAFNYVDGMPKGSGDTTAIALKDGDKEFKFLVSRNNADS